MCKSIREILSVSGLRVAHQKFLSDYSQAITGRSTKNVKHTGAYFIAPKAYRKHT